MITAKVTSKGQVTIPKKVREKLGVHPGEDVGFEEKNGLIYIHKTVKKLPLINGSAGLSNLRANKVMTLLRSFGAIDHRS